MSQSLPLKAPTYHRLQRNGQVLFTILALLAFVLGALLLIVLWFAAGSATPIDQGFDPVTESRVWFFIMVWPVTMLVVWICSIIALLLAKRWVLASVSLPAAFAVLYGVWYLVMFFLLGTPVMFTAFFLLLITGAIWLARGVLTSPSR